MGYERKNGHGRIRRPRRLRVPRPRYFARARLQRNNSGANRSGSAQTTRRSLSTGETNPHRPSRPAGGHCKTVARVRYHGRKMDLWFPQPRSPLAFTPLSYERHSAKQRCVDKPFVAVRSGDYWVVHGTLPSGMVGGTPITVIRAKDGAVLWMISEA